MDAHGMAVRDVFKISRKTFFNPKAWLGWSDLRANTSNLVNIIRDVTQADNPERKETFAQAMARLEVQEEDVRNLGEQYQLYAYFFLFLGTLAFFFGFYLLFRYMTLSGLVLSIAVTALFVAQAFKFDFWAFQIRKRKLGCTYQEWRTERFTNKDLTP